VLGFSLFITYQITFSVSLTFTFCPDVGDLNSVIPALTTGIISDSRATVETIKAFEENRIVYFEVDLQVYLCGRMVWTW